MKKFTSAEYALFRRITSVSAAPGEKWAWAETTVAPDESEQSRVHIGGGASFPGRFPRWSPSGRTLAWLGADENGAEQIWLCAPDGSDARKLTNLRHGVKRFSWAADESELAFEADLWDGEPAFGSEGLDQWKAEQALAPQCSEVLFCKLDDAHGMFPPCASRIGAVSVRTGETAMLDTLGIPALRPALSPDGKTVAFLGRPYEGPKAAEMEVFALDRADGGYRQLTQGGMVAGDADPMFTRDGARVIFTAYDMEGGFSELLRSASLADGTVETLLQEDESVCHGVNCQPVGRTFAHIEQDCAAAADGYIYFYCAFRGYTSLYRVPETGGAPEVVWREERSVSAFHVQSGSPLLAVIGDCTEPGDLHWVSGGRAERLTRRNEWLSEYSLAETECCWIPSTDGKAQLQVWLVHPVNEEPGRRYPTVLYIHGGPECADVCDFWHEYHALANAGMAVVCCNPRGSLGYGRAFADGEAAWGDGAAEDLMAALQLAVDRGLADPERLGVTGGSYGGYMTNKLIGIKDCFKAAVSQRPLVNTATSYGTGDMGFASTDKSAEEIRKIRMQDYIGGRVKGGLMGHVEEIHAATCFLHAFNDYRCSYEQSEQMFTALREIHPEQPLRLVMLPDDNHGVARDGRPANLMRHVEEMVLWFRRHLCNEEISFPADEKGVVAVNAPETGVRAKMWPRRPAVRYDWNGAQTLELPTPDGLDALSVHVLHGKGRGAVVCVCEDERQWIPVMEALRETHGQIVSFEAREDHPMDALFAMDRVGVEKDVDLAGFGRGATDALWLLENTRRFRRAAVYGASPSRLISYASAEKPGSRADYVRFRDFMWASLLASPVCYAEKIDAPLLVLHGMEDLDAPVEGAHQLFIAVKDTHPDVRTRIALFPRSGHELPAQKAAFLSEITRWLAE